MNAPIITSAHTHVGTPPPGYNEEWVTHTVHYHGFASLSTVQDDPVVSPEFMLLGNQWRLGMYPGGDVVAAEGMTSIYLYNESDKAIDIDYGFSVIDGRGKRVAYERTATPYHFASLGDGDGDDYCWGFINLECTKLLSSLVDGTLVIEVRMRLSVPTKSVPPPFIPENPVAKMIQGLFLDEKSSDIVFKVAEEKEKNSATKVAKTTPVSFPAHRLIIENCSSILAELCESHGDGTTLVQINDVKPNIFRLLLSHIYGWKVSKNDMVLHARDIIDAADKYGVVNLKLEAEASFVVGATFTIENVMELLLYAESKNCALLKEAAMDYIVENKGEVIEKLSFANAPGALITDVLAAVSRGERNVGGNNGDGGDSQYNAIRISELRKMAHEKGLNVDGSREMLIAALEAVQDLESEIDSDSEESDEDPVEE